MAITKSISFFAPYIVNELNAHVDNIAGGDALLYGGEITVNTSTTVDIAPYIFVQDGITVFQDEATEDVVVPDYSSFAKPVHILVSSPDSKNTSGVLISVAQGNEDIDESAIVLASRVQNVWSSAHKPSLLELRKDALLARADASGGRISDASVEFSESFGTNQGFHLKQGQIADSAGSKTVLAVDTSLSEPNSALEFDLTSVDPDFPRNDHIIARRISDNLNIPPEIVYAKGETLSVSNRYFEEASTTGSRLVNTSAGNTKPSVSYNATGEHVVVYGNGTDLYHARLDHTATRAIGAGPTGTPAGGAVSDVFLAERKDIKSGDRLYGCCIIDGEVAIFRTTADGAAMGDIEVFTSMTSTPAKPHMVITGEGTTEKPLYAHIFFQHQEAPSNNQIYYTKYALADATWSLPAAIAVEPRIARGINSGANHTDPHAAVHPNGDLHVVYVHTSIKSEIRYLVISQTGAVVEIEQALATGTGEINDGTGAAITIDDNCEQPRVVISPQGSVYVVWLDLSKTVLANEAVIAWDLTMLQRTGFHAVVLYSDFTIDGFRWHSAFSDDLGNLCWFGAIYNSGDDDEIHAYWFKFSPVLVSDGINIEPDNQCISFSDGSTGVEVFSVGSFTSEGEAILDRDGSLSVVDLEGNTVYHHKLSSMSLLSLYQDKKKPHPSDSYIANISIPAGSSNTIASASDVMVHQTKIKSAPPITVFGNDGNYGTFTGLQDAIWSLKGVGGKILVKGGEYIFKYPIDVISGVEIIGDGHVAFLHSGIGAGVEILGPGYGAVSVVDAANKRHSAGVGPLLSLSRPGDIAFLWDLSMGPADQRSDLSNPIVITKIISDNEFQADRDLTAEIGALTDPRIIIYNTGVKLQNITLIDDRAFSPNNPMLSVEYSYMSTFKDLSVTQTQGLAGAVVAGTCYGSRFENMIVNKSGANVCFGMGGPSVNNFEVTLSHCAFRGDVLLDGYVGLRVDGCIAETWNLVGDEAPVWTNNAGAISATSFDAISSWGDDASVFANRIVMNEDVGFDTNGNIRGNIVPIDNDSAIGNPAKKWEETVAQSHVARPENSSDGLVVSAEDLTNYWYNTEKIGKIVDYTSQTVNEMETSGNWAGCNILEDDFMYVDNNWVLSGTVQSSGWPDEKYGFFNVTLGGPYVSPDYLVPNALYSGAGGILGAKTVNASDEFTMYGCNAFNGSSLSATQKIVFKAKYAIGGGTDPTLHRTDELGLEAGSDYKIFVRYSATSSTGLPWYLVVDDGVNPETAVGIPVSSLAVDTWITFYIAIDSAKVEAWTSNADDVSDRASISFGTNPEPPNVSDKFSPYWKMVQGTTSFSKDGWLDYWRIQNNILRR